MSLSANRMRKSTTTQSRGTNKDEIRRLFNTDHLGFERLEVLVKEKRKVFINLWDLVLIQSSVSELQVSGETLSSQD